MWFKLNKTFFNLRKDLLICFLHIPPENSSYSIKEGDQFDILANDISHLSDEGDILLCGDFNARILSPMTLILSIHVMMSIT